MGEVFVSKLRPLGSSAGVIVPREVLEKEGLSIGSDVKLAVVKQDFKLLDKLIGTVRERAPFKRDRRDRI